MLALICNIYRGENYIPRNRPGVYEKCAFMLFEKWDRSRGINAHLPIDEAHVRSVLNHLAHWIYSDVNRRSGVLYHNIIEEATRYLHTWVMDDWEKANRAARDFIDFCKGRAWVLDEVGTTPEGEGLYQFVHSTFLEYFAAPHLVRICRTPGDLSELLHGRIAKEEWDVVAQLAFQIQAQAKQGAADELLQDLLNRSEKNQGPPAWNLLIFSARALEFMAPKPQVTRTIAVAALARVFTESLSKSRDPATTTSTTVEEEPLPEKMLTALLRVREDNRGTVAEEIGRYLNERAAGSPEETRVAVEMALVLPQVVLMNRYAAIDRSSVDFWTGISTQILSDFSTRLVGVFRETRDVAALAAIQGIIDISDLVRWHGVTGLFTGSRPIVLSWGYSSVADTSLILAIERPDELPVYFRKPADQLLSEIFWSLVKTPPPWFITGDSVFLRHYPAPRSRRFSFNDAGLSSAAHAAAILLLSAMIERSKSAQPNTEPIALASEIASDGVYSTAYSLWIAREKGTDPTIPATLPAEASALLTAWVRRDIQFAKSREIRAT